MNLISDSVAALFNKIGPGILITHSQSGGPGWITVTKSPNVKAVIAFEPGSNFVFPEGKCQSPWSMHLTRSGASQFRRPTSWL